MNGVLREARIERGRIDGRELAPTVDGFLRQLAGPVWFRLPGRDRSRCRAVTTLLHGNEPSGLHALHALLAQRTQPHTDVVCAILSVPAALEPPALTHRFLPGRRDLNRCFAAPADGAWQPEHRLAAALLDVLRAATPEALVDVHNTSGASPAYGVCSVEGPAQLGLVSLFADEAIVTDLRLATLMEAMQNDCTVITLESGGRADASSHARALAGLERYLGSAGLPAAPPAGLRISRHPVRIELRQDAVLAYGQGPSPGADVTLPTEIEQLNFHELPAGAVCGWLGPRGLSVLRARADGVTSNVEAYFGMEDGRLVAARPLRPLMVTTDPVIAHSDCLFYVVAA